MNYIIKKTTVWGDHYKVYGKNKLRLMKKSKIRRYPFVDQKGPAKETQTFILSYAYGNWTEEEKSF